MLFTDFPTDGRQPEFVVNRLQEQVASIEFSSFPIGDFPVWMEDNGQAMILFFLFVLLGFYPCLFPGPLHNVISGRAMLL